MAIRGLVCAVVAAAAALTAPAATAKDFGPGDLRLCNAKRCVPITKPAVLPLLGRFYYAASSPPTAARSPRLGAAAFELRFSNGYVTGIVATRRLDRFLSYGVHLRRFRRGAWYRIPAPLSAELGRLGAALEPLRLTRAALARSR
jgi:hypothetical protein